MSDESDVVKHYWDLCGGAVQTQEFNELANAAGVEQSGDFTQGNWKDIISPSSGKKLVVFGVIVMTRTSAAAGITAFRVGSTYFFDIFFSSAIALLRPEIANLTPPIVGGTDETIDVFSGGLAAQQSSVVVTYGEIV